MFALFAGHLWECLFSVARSGKKKHATNHQFYFNHFNGVFFITYGDWFVLEISHKIIYADILLCLMRILTMFFLHAIELQYRVANSLSIGLCKAVSFSLNSIGIVVVNCFVYCSQHFL